MTKKNTILVVEDDNDISNMISDLLEQNGYNTRRAYSGTEALMVFDNSIELVLLDLMLPGLAGELVLEEIRKKSNIPVIGISAKSDKTSTINLLKIGADDYIVKPFDNDELLARIEAQQRRYNQTSSFSGANNKLKYKDISIDTDTFTVEVGDAPVSLTKREFLILELLMKYPKKVFTKSNIYENVWNDEFYGDENTINVHISNIRLKLARVNPSVEYIQTVWGIGFKMSE